MQILQGGAFGFIKNLKSREQIKKKIKSGGQFLLVEKQNARICSEFVNTKKYVANCFLSVTFSLVKKQLHFRVLRFLVKYL